MMNDNNTNETKRTATKQFRPTVVKKWDLKDRGDGVELRSKFRDERRDKQNWSDEEARELAETILRVLDADDDDRPVTEGKNVR